MCIAHGSISHVQHIPIDHIVECYHMTQLAPWVDGELLDSILPEPFELLWGSPQCGHQLTGLLQWRPQLLELVQQGSPQCGHQLTPRDQDFFLLNFSVIGSLGEKG